MSGRAHERGFLLLTLSGTAESALPHCRPQFRLFGKAGPNGGSHGFQADAGHVSRKQIVGAQALLNPVGAWPTRRGEAGAGAVDDRLWLTTGRRQFVHPPPPSRHAAASQRPDWLDLIETAGWTIATLLATAQSDALEPGHPQQESLCACQASGERFAGFDCTLGLQIRQRLCGQRCQCPDTGGVASGDGHVPGVGSRSWRRLLGCGQEHTGNDDHQTTNV